MVVCSCVNVFIIGEVGIGKCMAVEILFEVRGVVSEEI